MRPRAYWLAIAAAACVTLGPARAEAQDRFDVGVAAGPADGGEGFVGHGGIRFAPGGTASWEAYRLDLTIGERGGYRLGAVSTALELGPPAIHTGGVRFFGLVGLAVLWTDDAVGQSAVGGAGVRVRVGPVWITAEQRFQQAFSPFLVGLSF